MPDERAGELVKAVVVANAEAVEPGMSQDAIAETLIEYVKNGKARHKWLSGGVEVVDAIPKSASGKILRRELKARGDRLTKSAFCETMKIGALCAAGCRKLVERSVRRLKEERRGEQVKVWRHKLIILADTRSFEIATTSLRTRFLPFT